MRYEMKVSENDLYNPNLIIKKGDLYLSNMATNCPKWSEYLDDAIIESNPRIFFEYAKMVGGQVYLLTC